MAPRIEQDRRARPPDFPPTGKVISYEAFLAAKARRDESRGPASPAPPALSTEGDRDALRREVERLPEVRRDRVRRARKRIRQGFYDRPEVLDEIVRRLLRGDRSPAPEDGGDR